jgi:hypothetical protein
LQGDCRRFEDVTVHDNVESDKLPAHHSAVLLRACSIAPKKSVNNISLEAAGSTTHVASMKIVLLFLHCNINNTVFSVDVYACFRNTAFA